jgi:endogenous inhibitor of DNA gyrase (YacG/DUF329 family)
MSDDTRARPSRAKAPRCPICGRPRVPGYRPFCSARCRDIDLGRWFGEVYTVPAAEPGYDEDETPDAPRREDGEPS